GGGGRVREAAAPAAPAAECPADDRQPGPPRPACPCRRPETRPRRGERRRESGQAGCRWLTGAAILTRPASPGALLRQALIEESPLQIIGAINASHALLAQRAGYRAIYLSGGGVAAGSLGLPDLGINPLDDVLTDVRRITDVCDLPLLVDIDTGFGPSAFNSARTVTILLRFAAAACHIQDQGGAARCSHRPRRDGVSTQTIR